MATTTAWRCCRRAWATSRHTRSLLDALAERGWSDDDLAKLTSGNILRVMREAEAGARALQAERGPSLATFEQLDGAPA